MRVLYIDDDALNRAVMGEMLKLTGVALSEASDATSGLRMFGEQAYDLVLMDLRMPGINGLTAIRHIRAQAGQGQGVLIIVVTADLSSGCRELCRSAGADGFLEKPVLMPELYRLVGTTLAGTGGAVVH